MAKPIIKGNLKDSDKVSLTYNGREVDMTVEDFKLVVAPAPTYKVYRALLTQAGTSAPVPTILENTIGDVGFTYIEPGDFGTTSTGLFTEGKTTLLMNLGSINQGAQYGSEIVSDSLIVFTTTDGSNVNSNGLLDSEGGSWIDIRVYD